MKTHLTLIRLSIAHFLVDHYSSMLGALLPFLMPFLDLSMTEAGLLGGALVFSGSLMQPVYGYLADHSGRKTFVMLGPAISGVFVSSLGLSGSFSQAFLLILMGGVGIAAFHPQAAAMVASARKEAPGVQLSIFITAGMLGFSMGPVLIASLVSLVGLSMSYLAAVPGLAFSLFLFLCEPAVSTVERRVENLGMLHRFREKAKPLSILFTLVVIRSAVQFVFASFLGVYLTTRGYTAYQAGWIMTAFLFVGASAGLLGGVFGDRIGGRRVIIISMSAALPCLLAFLSTDGLISLFFCFAGAASLFLTLPVNVSMAQSMFPEASSTISAIMMGFGWGIGGVALPVTGFLSDYLGLQTALFSLVWLCLPGIVLAFWLPVSGLGRRCDQVVAADEIVT